MVDKVREIGADPGLLREAIAAARREREEKRPELAAEARRLESEKRQLTSERKNLVDAVAQGGTGSATLMGRVGELDGAVATIEHRLAGARGELAGVHAATVDEDDLRAALASFDPVWNELFPRERARILALLIERVTYTRATGDVAITFRPSGVKSLGRRRESA